MSIKRLIRLFCSICLCCAIFFNVNIQSAKAETGWNYFVESGMADSAIESLGNGFVSGFGNVSGGIAGATAACYITNAAILPVAPPVAGALATYCPYIGGVAGSFGGTIVSKTAKKGAINIFRTLAPQAKHHGGIVTIHEICPHIFLKNAYFCKTADSFKDLFKACFAT